MNYENKEGVYARPESWNQFSVDKNTRIFSFLKKVIEKENCH